MPVIAVANPKGGVGKSTLATQVAGWLAHRGHAVMLGDLDRQQSSRLWLAQRPAGVPAIVGWDLHNEGRTLKQPKGTTHLVIDTPAGLHGKKLDSLLGIADALLVPLQATPFDIQATHHFLQEVSAHPRGAKVGVGVVGMRIKDHTLALDHLRAYTQTLSAPLVTLIRDTQNYVHLAARGLTLWDVAPGRVERDLAQWQALLTWLGPLAR